MPVPEPIVKYIKLLLDPDILSVHNQVFMSNFANYSFEIPSPIVDRNVTFIIEVSFPANNNELGELLENQHSNPWLATFGELQYPTHPEMAEHINLIKICELIGWTCRVLQEDPEAQNRVEEQIEILLIEERLRSHISRTCPTNQCENHHHIYDPNGADPYFMVTSDIDNRLRAIADYNNRAGQFRQ